MKPQIIRAEDLPYEKTRQVLAWLRSNGCPWLIGHGETILVTGNHIIVRTWTIKNAAQSATLWPRRLPEGWQPPTKLRKYRIRHELRWDK